jgi:hypothetical protein
VAGIGRSFEARERLVQSWYAAYLARAAQGGEASGWFTSLLAGASETDVLSSILSSPQFYARATTDSVRLSSGLDLSLIFVGITSSPEFMANG